MNSQFIFVVEVMAIDTSAQVRGRRLLSRSRLRRSRVGEALPVLLPLNASIQYPAQLVWKSHDALREFRVLQVVLTEM